MLEHLRRHSAGLPVGVQADDIADALVLEAALWWSEREREAALLRRARALGMSLSEIGARLGLSSKSATREHLDRLEVLLELTAPAGFTRTPAAGPRTRARPDGITDWGGRVPTTTDTTRARRQLARAAAGQHAWLHAHGHTVLGVITRLVSQIERALPRAAHAHDPQLPDSEPDTDGAGGVGMVRYGAAARTARAPVDDPDHDLGEWVDELRAELDATTPTPATMAALGLALGELDVHPGARALDPGHGLHRARRAAHRLRAAYADHSAPHSI